MFDDFLYNVYRSIKLDKGLYKDPKIFGTQSFYLSMMVIIFSGFAGLLAQNSFIESLNIVYNIQNISATNILGTVLSSIIGWFIWSALIYIIGVKLFSDTNLSVSFKSILIVVGYGHAPGLLRFLAVIPDLLLPIILITQLWIFLSIANGIKEILKHKSIFKSLGVVVIVFLIILLVFIFLIRGNQNLVPIS